ncbi:hypothetical protein ACHAXA_002721 [Cyclostephanos tholiformis]|uniref:FCP1 homology domain-containing protein n=1 Tax=Cyclostephanos tholiformis TaxID=382380 RepID=A0ABD3RBC8_9STRA
MVQPDDTAQGDPSSSSPKESAATDAFQSEWRRHVKLPRPIVFLDIDGVLNTTRHNTHVRIDDGLVIRLGDIVRRTDALIVYTTFWRHFHEYISYVLHRYGIDVPRHVLPYPVCTTPGGLELTMSFSRFHRTIGSTLEEEGGGVGPPSVGEGGRDESHVGKSECAMADENFDGSVGWSAKDECEYSSRADEIEAWLVSYGTRYLGSGRIGNDGSRYDDCKARTDDGIVGSKYRGYDYHPAEWRYVILDDRPCAAKPDSPLMDRFVQTDTRLGLTEADAERAVELLLYGPYGM